MESIGFTSKSPEINLQFFQVKHENFLLIPEVQTLKARETIFGSWDLLDQLKL
jgi:hypothetical protein